ncbi:hypothetical protein NDA14_000523 [Ustilago hordei]|uniref:Uncharacterized protein n=1 Tax=Ustilago hordei TaxID=120017 RepID=I2FTX4_USTHO|nr:uncharacterized protein UHO2_06129 [Ustilago hordei]KAJ1037884.1 hypothetical protein NDA10_003226 [Ustilago hordei]KAJ1594108.1 hypothetical protein NDA12_006457 [Ustilago hordei]KAJ1597463.1 hypothetical protein NDA14_000523 [Ustilago hordei]UTT88590.1 hypothetical protein NDA17_004646 [Ustilago hordei]CCF50367.1 uncharacterized protein UHOR_07977 [Ustilago hordei]
MHCHSCASPLNRELALVPWTPYYSVNPIGMPMHLQLRQSLLAAWFVVFALPVYPSLAARFCARRGPCYGGQGACLSSFEDLTGLCLQFT